MKEEIKKIADGYWALVDEEKVEHIFPCNEIKVLESSNYRGSQTFCIENLNGKKGILSSRGKLIIDYLFDSITVEYDENDMKDVEGTKDCKVYSIFYDNGSYVYLRDTKDYTGKKDRKDLFLKIDGWYKHSVFSLKTLNMKDDKRDYRDVEALLISLKERVGELEERDE